MNDAVERLVREYASAEGLGVTEAVAHAVRTARRLEWRERDERARREAAARYLEIAGRGWASDGTWTREELHER